MRTRREPPPWSGPPTPGLRVWALEPYHGGSHRQFLDGLTTHSRHHVTVHALPGRHWRWRMHGGAIDLAERSAAEVLATGAPQVLFASDMLDLATYAALADPRAAEAPALLYMHENQLSYPLPDGVERDLSYGVMNVTSALRAGAVLFNSEFHRREFLAGVEELLEIVPDASPRWALEAIADKSMVVPVGCSLRALDRHAGLPSERWGDPAAGPLVLWNQRWEYDKAPGDFFRALYVLQDEGVGFRVAVAGGNHGLPSAEFVEARKRLGDRVVQWGRLPDEADYASLLWAADVVVSTALHEFFGVGVVEAVYCGCRPVLPDRLSYPELIPHEARPLVLYPEGGVVDAVRRAVVEAAAPGASPGSPPWSADWQRTWVGRYDWSLLASTYDDVIHGCWEAGPYGGCAAVTR